MNVNSALSFFFVSSSFAFFFFTECRAAPLHSLHYGTFFENSRKDSEKKYKNDGSFRPLMNKI